MRDRVLVIDDDEGFRYIMKEYLHTIKSIHWFSFESDGLAALTFLQWRTNNNEFPNQIFLDLNMPGITGFEFLDQYQESFYHLHPETTVNIVTTSDRYDDKAKTLSYPFVSSFITKPVTVDNLLKVLK